jgi:hypothetical protein
MDECSRLLDSPRRFERGEVQGERFRAGAWPLGDTYNPHPGLSLGKGEAKEDAMNAYVIRYIVTSLHRISMTIQRVNDSTIQRGNFK